MDGAAPRMPTRGSAAALSAALASASRGAAGGRSAQPHTPVALPRPAPPGCAAAACRFGQRVGPDERVLHPRHRRLRRDEHGILYIALYPLFLRLVETRAER
eukprot:5530967-Prymnesium_polylepis.1